MEEEEESPASRPMTPNEQLTIMKMIGEEQAIFSGDPTERDLEVCLTQNEVFCCQQEHCETAYRFTDILLVPCRGTTTTRTKE